MHMETNLDVKPAGKYTVKYLVKPVVEAKRKPEEKTNKEKTINVAFFGFCHSDNYLMISFFTLM